jgi:DNA-binding NarL/FixJ family response regulator
MREISILFIRSEENPVQQIEGALAEDFSAAVEWVRVDSLFDGLRILQERSFDLVVSDLFLPDGQGLATIRHLTQQTPPSPVIVFCHSIDREIAVNGVRKGAHDFFCYEEFDPVSFRRSVQAALAAGNSGPEGATQPNPADRRNNARFPCRLAVSYQALEHPFLSGEAVSETLNISSKGLLFSTNEPLQTGQLLQVSVDWPARLENQVPLKLVAEGRIVRNINGQAAMRIDKYEFRTRRTKSTGGDAEKAKSADSSADARNHR